MLQNANFLTLYFYEPAARLSWDSPRTVTHSTLWNAAADACGLGRALGHVSVEIHQASSGRRVHLGMTIADRGEAARLLLRQGYGLGLMFHRFAGKLESTEELDHDVRRFGRREKIRFLRVLISDSVAARLLDYAELYAQAPSKSLQYGFPLSPRRREGGGCSAFAVSFLEVAGLLTPELESAWTGFCRIPSNVVGGPLTSQKISLLSLLSGSRGLHWAAEEDPHFPLRYWDPDRMFNWVGTVAKSGHRELRPERAECGEGLLLDRRSVVAVDSPILLSSPDEYSATDPVESLLAM